MKISLPITGLDPTILVGFQDELINQVQEQFHVVLSMRDDQIHIKGDPHHVRGAKAYLQAFIRARGQIGLKSDSSTESENWSTAVHTPKRRITPRSSGQSEYLQAIEQNDIVISIGPAGTGKTYLGVAMAVSYLMNRKVERIILTRPAVEAGESLGFLPGAIEEKVDPYLRPLYDALNDFLPYDRIRKYQEMKVIEVAPLAYMRGRTLNDAFIILDEAQNTTGMQMKMFLTRMGWRSKTVVTGDITQVDLPGNIPSGLIEIQHLLKNIKGIQFVYMNEKDVVRHHLVQEIIRAYETKS